MINLQFFFFLYFKIISSYFNIYIVKNEQANCQSE